MPEDLIKGRSRDWWELYFGIHLYNHQWALLLEFQKAVEAEFEQQVLNGEGSDVPDGLIFKE